MDRQVIPEGLAEMAPGPQLGFLLAGLDPARLTGADCVAVLRAQYRQLAYDQARLMAVMVQTGLCGIGPADAVIREEDPSEFAADEIRAALVLTRRAADTQSWLAIDVVNRLPAVHAALQAGVIDQPKARIFADWTRELLPDQARAVCARLLPCAADLTTSELIEEIKKLAIAIDPEWAARRYREAVTERRVVGYRNPDGTANLSGLRLPVDEAAAACAHIDALAHRVKAAGDARPIDQIRADLYLRLLDGSYQGWHDQAIVTDLLTTTPTEPTTTKPPATTSNQAASRPAASGPAASGVDAGVPVVGGVEAGGRVVGGLLGGGLAVGGVEITDNVTSGSDVAAGSAGDDDSVDVGRAAVELYVPLIILLGLDDHPAEIAESGSAESGLAVGGPARNGVEAGGGGVVGGRVGGGPVVGGVEVAADVTGCSDVAAGSAGSAGGDGAVNVVMAGDGWGGRAAVELHVRLTTLLGLDDYPAEIAGWGPVVADVAREVARQQSCVQWRYAVCDDDGAPLSAGIVSARPNGYPRRRAGAVGGVVELLVPLSLVLGLAEAPDRFPQWAKVIAEIARRTAATDAGLDGGNDAGVEGGQLDRRLPTAQMRRRVQARDRRCQFRGCRTPATACDTDHRTQWQHGGRTQDHNLQSLCRHDHRLKDEGGWAVTSPEPGLLRWTSPLGQIYLVKPPAVMTPMLDPRPRPQISVQRMPEQDHEPPIWWEPLALPQPEEDAQPPPDPEPPPF